jgi:hypothetical protein
MRTSGCKMGGGELDDVGRRAMVRPWAFKPKSRDMGSAGSFGYNGVLGG